MKDLERPAIHRKNIAEGKMTIEQSDKEIKDWQDLINDKIDEAEEEYEAEKAERAQLQALEEAQRI
jgi:hypothetical protein